MKKIINDINTVVQDMCSGIVLAHPELELIPKSMVIKKKDLNPNKVSLVSGGGSGHEPAHAGFIGKGMLDCAVCGDVFASPSQVQVYQGIRETAGNKGTLLIIKNYSGDIMNFKNAAYFAGEDGIEVDYVRVDDDIAVKDSLYTVGHRGVAGTIFIHKIAGAMAERGAELPEVKRVAEKAIANVKSIGFALTSCTVPAKGSPTFELGEDEIEYGVGIHGEPGIRRESMLDAKELAGRMIVSLCNELGLKASSKQRVAVLTNGFGATPLMELYILHNEIMRELAEKDIIVARSFVGNYMTSIDMAGASISILKLDEELESLLDDPSDTPAFKIAGPVEERKYQNFFAKANKDAVVRYDVETDPSYAKIGDQLTLENMMFLVDTMSESIIRNEVPFCELDTHAGDGDFGMSIAKGFRELKSEWHDIINQPQLTIAGFLHSCSLVIMQYCGGASGPIWGSAFRSAGKAVEGKETLSVSDFAHMMEASVLGIQTTGERSFGRGAQLGDKTLIDALLPCADSWVASGKNGVRFVDAFQAGAQAAVDGAEKTKDVVARMGRAGVVGERSLGYPDAGAYGLGVIFTDIANAVEQK